MFIRWGNVLPLNCASVVSSRICLGSLFQALAAENLNEVCPHLVLTCGRSNSVGSLIVSKVCKLQGRRQVGAMGASARLPGPQRSKVRVKMTLTMQEVEQLEFSRFPGE